MFNWLGKSLGFGGAEPDRTEHHGSDAHANGGAVRVESRQNQGTLEDRFSGLGISTYEQESVHVGSRFNQWQRPKTEYGESDSSWIKRLENSDDVGKMDISKQEWARAQEIVEQVLNDLLTDMKVRATKKFKGLLINKFVRQGSARDGLKVIAPDEFDTGFEFWIEGISFKQCPIIQNGKCVPGFCYIKVNQTKTKLENKCPELLRKEVFKEWKDGAMYLSSKNLHLHVFQSLMDQSIGAVAAMHSDVTFSRKMNPPAINVTITLSDDACRRFAPSGMSRQTSLTTKKIDVDIIPALRLDVDQDSKYNDEKMNAVVHVICKWKEDESALALELADQNFIWLINSVAYERHIFDVARDDSKQRYIITALRLVKTYLTRVKASSKEKGSTPPPIAILKSYHLKQVACYVILYACFLYPSTPVKSAQQALAYLLSFLHVCLDQTKLPHFFYSNPQIGAIFDGYPFKLDEMYMRYNLFRKVKSDALLQAKISLKKHMAAALDVDFTDRNSDDLSAKFSSNISDGEYF